MPIRHAKQSTLPDQGSTDLVQPSDWNESHQVDGGIILPSESPSAPASGAVTVHGYDMLGGEVLPGAVTAGGSRFPLQASLAFRKTAKAHPFGNLAATVASYGCTMAASAGTAVGRALADTNVHTACRRVDYAQTTPATNAAAGFRANTATFRRTPFGGLWMALRFGPSIGTTNANHRLFAGMFGTAGTATDVDPATQNDCIGVGYDSADTHFHFITRSNSGTATKVQLTDFPKPSAENEKVYDLLISFPKGQTAAYYRLTDVGTGAVAEGSVDSPSNMVRSVALVPWGYMSAGGVSSTVGIAFMGFWLEGEV
jgi:hypothetical protein